MFRTFHLSIIRSSFTVHSAMVYVIQVGRQLSYLVVLENCHQTRMTYASAECTVANSWRWTEELSETCRVLWQNKVGKLVRLFGFIVKKRTVTELCGSGCRGTAATHFVGLWPAAQRRTHTWWRSTNLTDTWQCRGTACCITGQSNRSLRRTVQNSDCLFFPMSNFDSNEGWQRCQQYELPRCQQYELPYLSVDIK